MSSTTMSFQNRLRSAGEKYGSQVAAIIVIVFGVAAIVMVLSPR